jgi:KTSC domain
VRQSVTSSMILAVEYDNSSEILEIEFRRGPRVYRYFEVPEFLYRGLLAARSKGQFFTTRIAGRYRTECGRG